MAEEDLERELLEHRKWKGVSEGIFDLGYRAGELNSFIAKVKEMRFKGKEIPLEEKKKIVGLACSLSDNLEPYGWHHADEDTETLLGNLIENQVGGRDSECLCDVAISAVRNDKEFDEFIDALDEIENMLVESCGQDHILSIVGCKIGKDEEECEALEGWRKIREKNIKAHHKQRISPETLEKICDL